MMDRYGGHFLLAHELGVPLNDLLGWPGPTTHRQYLAWQEFLAARLGSKKKAEAPEQTVEEATAAAKARWAARAGKKSEPPGAQQRRRRK